MKPPQQTITLDQARAIREIEQHLAELESMRQCIAREMQDDADTKPAACAGVKVFTKSRLDSTLSLTVRSMVRLRPAQGRRPTEPTAVKVEK